MLFMENAAILCSGKRIIGLPTQLFFMEMVWQEENQRPKCGIGVLLPQLSKHITPNIHPTHSVTQFVCIPHAFEVPRAHVDEFWSDVRDVVTDREIDGFSHPHIRILRLFVFGLSLFVENNLWSPLNGLDVSWMRGQPLTLAFLHHRAISLYMSNLLAKVALS